MADKENERQILTEEGSQLAKEEGFIFKECSCLKNENVDDAFWTLIEIWNSQNKKKNIIQEKGFLRKEKYGHLIERNRYKLLQYINY